MKNQKISNALIFGLVFLSLTVISYAQTKPLIKRTTYKSEKIEFVAGGTVSVIGAPVGAAGPIALSGGSVALARWVVRSVRAPG